MKGDKRGPVSPVAPEECQADVLDELGHRGERPLSFLDLIELESFDLELGAWLMSRVSRGASFVVGARPGGAGKTTTVRALLGLAPGSRPFAIARPGQLAGIDGRPRCFVAHELSDHSLPGYLWGQDLRDFCALSAKGHMLAANLHADDLEETRAQICGANGVPEAHFRALHLFAFIRLDGDGTAAGRRFIDRVHYSDGAAAHATVFTRAGGLSARAPRQTAYEERCRAFLEEALAGRSRTIEGLRRRFLDWEGRQAKLS
jgi:hypothetical protein